MNNRYIIIAAQVVSSIFSPLYLPVLAFIVLLFFSYMSYTSWVYNLQIIGMVYVFTVLLPALGIYVYRKINGWKSHQLTRRERRFVPYALSIASYAILLYLMDTLRMPRFTLGIVSGALAIQIICALLNPWIKVSTHAAAGGGVVGAVMAFSLMLNFDPTIGLCLSILVAGVVSTSRLILRQHSLLDVALGTLIGFFCALFFIQVV
jgi:membrane-associated phospholipid phosphatase